MWDVFNKYFFIFTFSNVYSYSDHWTYITQRLVFLSAMVVYLEAGFLVTRETVAEMLGCKYKYSSKNSMNAVSVLGGSIGIPLNYKLGILILVVYVCK